MVLDGKMGGWLVGGWVGYLVVEGDVAAAVAEDVEPNHKRRRQRVDDRHAGLDLEAAEAVGGWVGGWVDEWIERRKKAKVDA